MRTRPLTPALLLAVCVATPAFARFELPAERTTYQLKGMDSERGFFTSTIAIDPNTGIDGVEVVRLVRYDEQPDVTFLQRGLGRVEGEVLEVTLRASDGAAGAVDPGSAVPPVVFQIQLREGRLDAVGQSPISSSRAQGRVAAPAEAAEPASRGGFLQKGKHLLAVAGETIKGKIKRERDKLVYDGVGLDQEFGITSFLHVGVGGEIRALRSSALSPEQIYASRSRPDHVWLVNTVHGGVRVPLSTSIPVGDVTVSVGLNTAARVDYEVTDLYPMPEGVSREGLSTAIANLRLAATRSFDLPLDASDAASMTIGARRVFDGAGSIAVSGRLGIGGDVTSYGTRRDSSISTRDVSSTVKIGASAHVGGFYRIQGDVRIVVERLLADRVRVRVRRGDTTTRGADANLFLGAAVNERELSDELRPAVEYVDESLLQLDSLPRAIRDRLIDEASGAVASAVAGKIRQAVRFRVRADASESVRDEIDISHTYDLNVGRAREAYERAVRGDFTLAATLTTEPGSGVYQEFRVLEVEEHTHLGVNVDLSILLAARATRDIRVSTIKVEDGEGARTYEVFRLDRDRTLRLFDDRHKRMSIEVIRRHDPSAPNSERVRSSLRMTLDILDPHTFSWQGNKVKRLLGSWGLDPEGSIPMGERQFGRSRYGETRLRVRVDIADAGLRQALASSDADRFKAYVYGFQTIEDKMPLWATESGRREIERATDDRSTPQMDRAERELKEAKRFMLSMRKLARATDAESRAEGLKALAKSAKFDHYVLAAIMNLVPRDQVSIDASFLGDRVRIVDGRASEQPRVTVVDPR